MLEENKLYKIKVRSFYDNGLTIEYSSYSSFINAYTKPIEPTIQPATNVTSSSFDANWTLPSGVTQVKLYVSSNNFSSNDILDETVVAGTTYTVSGLSGNTEYKYKVKGIGIGIDSNYSGFETVTTEQDNLKIDINFGSNSSNDLSGNSNNATLLNGASLVSGGLQTGDTHHLLLDGTNDYAKVNYNSNYNSADFTAEIIFSFESGVGDYLTPILTRYDLTSDATNAQFALFYINSRLACQMYDETYIESIGNNHKYAVARSNAVNGLTNNTKYVLQFSWNQTTKTAILKLDNTAITIINAGAILMSALNINSTNNASFLIGAYIDQFGNVNSNYSQYTPNLKIARTRYWTKALSSSEMTDSYNLINT